jgi:histidinol-phosphate aminotransferase
VVLLRTFSKIYGIAGLRAGFAIARKDLLACMTPWNAGAMPAPAMAAAHAALGENRPHRGTQARQRGATRRPDALLRRAGRCRAETSWACSVIS